MKDGEHISSCLTEYFFRFSLPIFLSAEVEKWGALDCASISLMDGIFFMHWFRTGILNTHPVFDGE
jgi:hypothetical protein